MGGGGGRKYAETVVMATRKTHASYFVSSISKKKNDELEWLKMIFIRMLAYVTHWYQLHFRPLITINTHFFLNVTISNAHDHYFIIFFLITRGKHTRITISLATVKQKQDVLWKSINKINKFLFHRFVFCWKIFYRSKVK